MKKYLLNAMGISLALTLGISAVGCGKQEAPQDNVVTEAPVTESKEEEKEPEDEEKEETSESTEAEQTEELLLFDYGDFKISAIGIEDSYLGPVAKFRIENLTDQNYIVQSRGASVNGYMVTVALSQEVRKGKKAIADMYLLGLEEIGVNSYKDVKEIELEFIVLDGQTWNEAFTTDTVTVYY